MEYHCNTFNLTYLDYFSKKIVTMEKQFTTFEFYEKNAFLLAKLLLIEKYFITIEKCSANRKLIERNFGVN